MGKPLRKAKTPSKLRSRRASGSLKGAQSSGERDPSKWLHHSLKTIHKALKQAKNFEVRKIARRLALARKEAADATGSELISKLEQQLHAAKQADLDVLAQQAALKAGLPVNSSRDAPTPPDSSSLSAAVHQRLVSAACVQKQLAQQATDFKRKFGSTQQQQQTAGATAEAVTAANRAADDDEQPSSKRQKHAAADMPSKGASTAGDEPVGATSSLSRSEDPTTDSEVQDADADDDDDDDDSNSSVDLEAEYEAQQQHHESDTRPPDDSELDAATLAVLEKLRARSKASAEESDDSGAISDGNEMDDSDDEQQQQPAFKYPPPPALIAAAASNPGVKPVMSKAEKLQLKKRQKLEKLLKRGKRLGQRMRRQLYEKLYGSNAKHLQDGNQHHRERSAGRQDSGRSSSRQQQQQADNQPGRTSIRGRGGVQVGSAQGRQQQQQQRDKKPPANSSQQQQTEEQLHPSWAARKQQQKQIAVAATGSTAAARKVVFGDDGEVMADRQPAARQKQQQQEQNPQQVSAVRHATPQQQQPMLHNKGRGHPGSSKQQPFSSVSRRPSSWPAAAGGVGSSRVPQSAVSSQSAELHPSWQARKKQQASLVFAQPTGKKTVFGDD